MGGMYFEHVCSMSKQIEDWDWDSDWKWVLRMGNATARMGIEFIASIYLCVCQCQTAVAPPRPTGHGAYERYLLWLPVRASF